MSAGILDDIDRAISDCGVSGDAMRWTPEISEDSPGLLVALIGAEWGYVTTQPMPVADDDVIVSAYYAAYPLTVTECVPSQDFRERALEARRNRNTGPQAVVRAPRRIDPKGLRR